MKTLVRSKWIRSLSICVMGATGLWLMSGLGCGADGGLPGAGGGGGSSDTPTGAILSPTSNVNLENGQSTSIQYFAQSPSSGAKLDIYLDRDSSRGNGNEVDLVNGIDVPAGTGGVSGSLTFNSTNVPNSTYYVFGIIHYGDGLSQALSFVSAGAIVVSPVGTQPQPQKPTVIIDEPTPNLGLASTDVVTVQYRYTSPSAPATITLALDVDRDPTNDDINNPGDPNDPNVKLIVLPSTPRDANDPTFGNDPPPPDNPNTPPTNVDSVEIRKNPRQLPATTAGLPAVTKVYRFAIDFSRIPPRANGQPYYVRAVIQATNGPQVNAYATGAITISQVATGIVSLGDVGFRISGAQFQGFSAGEYLGLPAPIRCDDIDQDTVGDFMLGSRYGSPRNRNRTGAAYLVLGRRKIQYPPDTNGNGIPDTRDENGNVVDFPTPPTFIYDPQFFGNISPYDPRVVGRFGGRISVNSIGTLAAGSFYRGATYLMPKSNSTQVPMPATLVDPYQTTPYLPPVFTSGLTSITRLNLTGNDGTAAEPRSIPDFVFGIPFINNPRDYVDDDPCDKAAATDPPPGNIYIDPYPDPISTPTDEQQRPTDDLWATAQPNATGLMIMVSGSNDLANTFRQYVDAGFAGQLDPNPNDQFSDDEGFVQSPETTPIGMRIRGAWFGAGMIPYEPLNEFGTEVAQVPSLDNDLVDDFLLSVPGDAGGVGRIDVYLGQNFLTPGFYSDPVRSIPTYVGRRCGEDPPGRSFTAGPAYVSIKGASAGDRLSHPKAAGDINQDGPQDIMFGAPGATANGLAGAGIFYILFNPAGGFGNTNLGTENPPRLEIRGTHTNDHFGEVQDRLGDVNGDGIEDIAFASRLYDKGGLTDRGFVGVIFGNRSLTGELGFAPETAGTLNLPGLRFFGTHAGDQAGASVASAGDFNRDGYGDFIITCPGEQRAASDGSIRRGVAYLIFGGSHFLPGSPNYTGPEYTLSQVGSAQLPGVVFLSPYVVGDPLDLARPATIETASGVGDVDGDGFDDITLGIPGADFVFNPNSPTQRRQDAGEVYLIYGSDQ